MDWLTGGMTILAMELIAREVWRVAVYYPEGWEKYGGVREFANKAGAMQEREQLLALNHKFVHVWRVVETMVAT